MPHMNNFHFPEYTYAFKFLHITEDNFRKQNLFPCVNNPAKNNRKVLLLPSYG